MISSLLSNNKQVVALYPINNSTGEYLFKLLDIVLKVLTQVGYKVVTTISVNNKINRGIL